MGFVKRREITAFKRILIANRGEISCRIQKTCHRLGIETIAVGSTVDQDTLHMQIADTSVVIGGAEARESYLNGKAILEAAVHHRAEGIHPGYGFLSENPDFAKRVRDAGLIFIGPPTEAIRVMGSKSQAKALAQSVNVPVIPGYEGEGNLRKAALQLGFPLLIKATYGGGGKGMRRVNEVSEFEAALAACQREAKAAFGNDQVMLEKYLVRPRHVEVQILGDRYGKCIALSDRDCSLQRRHQKVIEEAPAPDLTATVRKALHEAAISIGKAVAYEGVGTVEFLVTDQGEYYFLEMNTRLQVEHPVTEMVLGLDLVEYQLRVAVGEPLLLEQKDQHTRGHAIEARVYAEDADLHFLPSTGMITQFDFPAEQDLRVDTGLREGDAVTIYYDPMIAKMIAWGQNREAALTQLREALSRTHVKGLKTNLNFLRTLLNLPDVIKTAPDIDFIDRYVDQRVVGTTAPEEIYLLAGLWLHHRCSLKIEPSPWSRQDGWRLNTPPIQFFHFADGGTVSLASVGESVAINWNGKIHQANEVCISLENDVCATIDGKPMRARINIHEEEIHISIGDQMHRLRQADLNVQSSDAVCGPAHLTAPMPGRVVSVMVAINESVETGQPLIILEAMKMEHTIRAPHEGIVDYLPFSSGDFCEEGVELVRLRGSKTDA